MEKDNVLLAGCENPNFQGFAPYIFSLSPKEWSFISLQLPILTLENPNHLSLLFVSQCGVFGDKERRSWKKDLRIQQASPHTSVWYSS